jgi:hypothetical protein
MKSSISILEEIFSDSFSFDSVEPKSKNYKQAVSVIEFPCCHPDDNEALTLIWPDLQNGPWIAGGACLRWYQNQPVGENDIDIFCADKEQAHRIIDHIKSFGRYSTKYESENATTLSYHSHEGKKHWTLQIIKRRYFNSLEEVINNFDITVCQIGTGGNDWLLAPKTAKDIRERNLRMHLPLLPEAAKRLVKYWTYGYRPVDELVRAVIDNPSAIKYFDASGDYENAF